MSDLAIRRIRVENHSAMNSRSKLALRLGLIAAGLIAGLVAVEAALRAAGLPRFYKGPTELTPRFAVLAESTSDGCPVWINAPGIGIRFRYDGNPRDYFDQNNELVHFTNKSGFRGGEFETGKPTNTLRIAVLGDSFTFGEGVRFEHTYPERAAALLADHLPPGKRKVECYNFGVGGYNTSQAFYALNEWALQCRPDIVVLGFTLNDAEPSLYEIDPATDLPKRRPREKDIPESLADPMPPGSPVYSSAIARFLWRYRAGRKRANRIIAFYHALYAEEQPGWQTCRKRLRDMARLCEQHNIPFVVLLFPALIELNSNYPFAGIHEQIRTQVDSTSALFVDLLPALKGRNAADLWVHPTDQHPNEIVHDTAARTLVHALAASNIPGQLLKAPKPK